MAHALAGDRKNAVRLHRNHPATGTPFESLTASFRLLRRLVAEQLEEDRLAVTDFWALTWIDSGESSPTGLGRLLAVSPAGITQLLDRLERRGLLRRSRSAGDRRATVLSLTAEGRRLRRRAGARCSRFLGDFATEFTPTGLVALQTVSNELGAILARRHANPTHSG